MSRNLRDYTLTNLLKIKKNKITMQNKCSSKNTDCNFCLVFDPCLLFEGKSKGQGFTGLVDTVKNTVF